MRRLSREIGSGLLVFFVLFVVIFHWFFSRHSSRMMGVIRPFGGFIMLALVSSLAQAQERPNFLFLLTDQFRYEALGANGNVLVRTPELDRLAATGVRFENCYTAQALCTPSRATILTGRYPHSHGLQDNVYGIPSAFDLPHVNLRPNFPELLRAAGYFTAYIGKWHLGEGNPGTFDLWKGYNSLLPHWLGEPYNSPYRSDVETDQALKFLEDNRGRSFLLFISYYPPHTPYTAPRRFHEHYQGKSLEPMEYYAAVSAVDWNVGRLLARLRELGLEDKTCVIFTTEHGETFRRRPGSRNKRVAYDESARIPLLIRLPGRLPAGLTWRSGTSSVNIMPTILELAGLPIPPEVEGRSLVGPILRREDEWREPVVIQNVTDPVAADSRALERAIRTQKWKLIIKQVINQPNQWIYELYDMEEDPSEKVNLFGSGKQAAVIRDLAQELMAWGRRFHDDISVKFAQTLL